MRCNCRSGTNKKETCNRYANLLSFCFSQRSSPAVRVNLHCHFSKKWYINQVFCDSEAVSRAQGIPLWSTKRKKSTFCRNAECRLFVFTWFFKDYERSFALNKSRHCRYYLDICRHLWYSVSRRVSRELYENNSCFLPTEWREDIRFSADGKRLLLHGSI